MKLQIKTGFGQTNSGEVLSKLKLEGSVRRACPYTIFYSVHHIAT